MIITNDIRSIAVFSGSNSGRGDAYKQGAAALGQAIAGRGITVVYGGTHVGLMGIMADAAIAAGGAVHGVITERLIGKGHLHEHLTRHEVVPSMRQRKQRMADLADAFIALPGGIGTLEEFAEVWTLNQLGEFRKPVGLLDLQGFHQPFMGFIDHMIAEQFLPAAHRASLVVDVDPKRLIDGLVAFEPVTASKWIKMIVSVPAHPSRAATAGRISLRRQAECDRAAGPVQCRPTAGPAR
jgi:uncharacterized protein (TIGR00730 family)